MISVDEKSITIDVDLLQQIERVRMVREFPETKRALLRSAQLVEGTWKRKAVELQARRLEEYVKSIRVVSTGDLSYRVENSGDISVEDDVPPYDLKPGLLKGPKAKQGKTSTYNTVPFGHKTKDMGDAGVLADAKKLEQSVVVEQNADRGRRYRWRGRLRSVPDDRRTKQTPVGKYMHKSPKYAGLVRMKGDQGLKQKYSSYNTFRRVSTNSDPASWWHPGFAGKPIRDEVIKEVRDTIVSDVRDAIMQDINNIISS